MSYRLSLVLITRGTAPARQGRLASLYAAITCAAVAVVGAGFLAALVNYEVMAQVEFVLIGALMLLALPAAPRLDQTLIPVE
ncbi:hypothetical protein [Pseudodonghicola flavimaris]|uniref:hypothetical protein n=1 Tax=Pseudodonghicola flavimaris TaxID=3050036 RepID=UPI0025425CFA|nr:hypothetical protein [Pseudodonghicola flavimaris]